MAAEACVGFGWQHAGGHLRTIHLHLVRGRCQYQQHMTVWMKQADRWWTLSPDRGTDDPNPNLGGRALTGEGTCRYGRPKHTQGDR